jgi:hypothetical protein
MPRGMAPSIQSSGRTHKPDALHRAIVLPSIEVAGDGDEEFYRVRNRVRRVRRQLQLLRTLANLNRFSLWPFLRSIFRNPVLEAELELLRNPSCIGHARTARWDFAVKA